MGFSKDFSTMLRLFMSSTKLAPLKAPPALVPRSIPKLLAKPNAPDKPPPPDFSSSKAKLKLAVYSGLVKNA